MTTAKIVDDIKKKALFLADDAFSCALLFDMMPNDYFDESGGKPWTINTIAQTAINGSSADIAPEILDALYLDLIDVLTDKYTHLPSPPESLEQNALEDFILGADAFDLLECILKNPTILNDYDILTKMRARDSELKSFS